MHRNSMYLVTSNQEVFPKLILKQLIQYTGTSQYKFQNPKVSCNETNLVHLRKLIITKRPPLPPMFWSFPIFSML
ncbi:hypothetical protein VNO80_29308 [Phaseolus coccineus]|uniref:Uncharacterized protein n=1 Tax=Phaseolus coccineus TaxID=3886 RepID=A0AAN9QCA8_PHACN